MHSLGLQNFLPHHRQEKRQEKPQEQLIESQIILHSHQKCRQLIETHEDRRCKRDSELNRGWCKRADRQLQHERYGPVNNQHRHEDGHQQPDFCTEIQYYFIGRQSEKN